MIWADVDVVQLTKTAQEDVSKRPSAAMVSIERISRLAMGAYQVVSGLTGVVS